MELNDLIRQFHDSSTQLVLAITGGGSRAIAELLEEPGGSRTLLEAVVPYSAAALSRWLGAPPENFCSARTARAMAMAAYWRAQQLSADSEVELPLAGIGCTASLVSDRLKRGPHRIHVALQTDAETVTYSVELVKGHRDRPGEEQIATRLVLNAIAAACGLLDGVPLDLLKEEPVTTVHTIAPPAWRELLAGRVALVRQSGTAAEALAPRPSPRSAEPVERLTPPRAIFPGAFNPLHDGHRQMAELAGRLLSLPVEFEISIENVDKPPLDFTEMEQRAAQFAGQTLWFTRAATFERKAALFPQATFIIGVDTLRRIADPRYYGGSPAAAAAAIERIAASGCRFLVFGRAADGDFQTLAHLNLPESLARLCREVPPDQFRADVSSSELRRRADD